MLSLGGGLRILTNGIASDNTKNIKKSTAEKSTSSVAEPTTGVPKITVQTVEDKADKSEKAESEETKTEAKTNKNKSKSEKTAKKTATVPLTLCMPIKGDIQKPYSDDKLIYSNTYSDMRTHEGIDITAEDGATVTAAGNGTIAKITDEPLWGKTVVINHGNGLYTYYSGLKDCPVKAGTEVKMGKIIGTVGVAPSECLDKSHLHFGVMKAGKWVSPLKELGLE